MAQKEVPIRRQSPNPPRAFCAATYMTEYWVSQARHWCEYCKIFINGSKPSIAFHENGRKHKEIVELFMKDMRKRGRERRHEEQEVSRELQKIERDAMRQYMKDAGPGPRSGGGGAVAAVGGGPADRAARLAELEARLASAKQQQLGGAAFGSAAGGAAGGKALPPPDGWRVKANPDGR